MSQPAVIVIGAGGHAAVVGDALLAGGARLLGFTDMNSAVHGSTLCGRPVLGGDEVLNEYDPAEVMLANGLGSLGHEDRPLRQRVQEALEARGWRFCRVVHPAAIVSPFAQLASSAQVLAGAVVQPRASVGVGVIVNTRAVVEHDVRLGDWCHVAPGAVVCGDVSLGAGSHVGAGAVVRQGVKLGEQVLVGAGATVVGNFAGPCVLTGVPARPMESKQ
ncbi:acetyltransferase [Pelomonas sp. SE-A7]|uniref:acetyltransferase n=1 Tax=Pelomonas sp. SE-A7 TaxID=3054953 RepID=UPI00259CBB65|nr:acetyltransferase [Pelomonas sp. SE-A7]MDM4767509.1 acetyltransferase [Pelomonas sp. SE-A7]